MPPPDFPPLHVPVNRHRGRTTNNMPSIEDDGLHHHRRRAPSIGAIPVPHGPETGTDHASFPYSRNPETESAIFDTLLKPNDSYNAAGTYWADLPYGQRAAFVSKVDREEVARELKEVGHMTKQDPLSPVSWYFREAVLPGAGLGLEGYVLFSIGNLKPLFESVWSTCWKTHEVCSENWISAVTYLEIIGIIVGQMLVGVMGDW